MSERVNSGSKRPPFTQEELDLLATPDAELESKAFKNLFDVEKVDARVGSGDLWQQLFQAHLHFEHVLSQMLADALVDPDAISASRMNFSQKVEMVQALGLIPKELVIAIKSVNTLRNKIAHDLHFEISAQHQSDLRSATPKYLRDVAKTNKGRAHGPLRFSEVLIVLLWQTEVIRQKHVLRRLRTRKSELGLRMVLDKPQGVTYRE